MTRSSFELKGLNLGTGDKNITYIYGLSDFWALMFEGSDKINLLLEANSQTCSDVYSKFLQLTSTLSLAQVQTGIGYQTKLVLINDASFVDGSVNVYNLPEIITSARYLSDRPMLPNLLLEENVHYSIINDGAQIQFSTPLNALGFPVRTNQNGSKDYAIWFTDSNVDELIIYNYFGRLIGLNPHTSTENFKNFVQGLYYLYVNGPTVDWIKKGLNLALGVPLARATEVVLDIRKYLDSNQYLVTTDSNSYLIPFGLSPSVALNDTLNLGDTLAEWIEVQDWLSEDEWWLNLYIPSELIPYIPTGETDRHALPGSYADYLMANFLKTHSFLVNVLVVDHSNLEFLVQIPGILSKAKPTYTFPVYIWTVPNDELIDLRDDDFQIRWDQFKCENLSVPIGQMTRSIVFGNFSANHHPSLTVSNSGRDITYTGAAAIQGAKTDFAKQSGKWYWEMTCSTNSGLAAVGAGQANDTVSADPLYSTVVSLSAGDVVSLRLDLDPQPIGTLDIYKNNVHVTQIFVNGPIYPMFTGKADVTMNLSFNFGQDDFVYDVPDGFCSGFFDKLSLGRSCPQFIRSNISDSVQQLVGGSAAFNGVNTNLDGGTLTGFINVENQYRGNTNQETAWLRAMVTRNTNEPLNIRGKIALNRRGATPGIFPVYALTSAGTKATVTFNPFASWDPTKIPAALTLNGNAIGHNADQYCWGTTVATLGVSSDKWYWENTITAAPYPCKYTIGIGNPSTAQGNYWVGEDVTSWAIDVEQRNILTFDGNTNSLLANYDAAKPSLDALGNSTQSFSIELRFKVNDGTVDAQYLLTMGSAPFNTNGTGIGIRYRKNGTGDIQAVRSDGVGFATRLNTAVSSVAIGSWYHYMFVYDAVTNIGYQYLNGLASGDSGTVLSGINTFTYNYNVQVGDGTDAKFNGSVSDVRIFNRALSATEALERSKYYNKSSFGVIAYWPINEGTGTTCFDNSGNSINLNFVATPIWSQLQLVNKVHNGVLTNVPTTLSQGDILSMTYDRPTNNLYCFKNGVLMSTITSVTGTLYPVVSINTNSTTITSNLGSSAFTYPPQLGAVPGIYDKAETYQYAVGEIVTIAGATNSGYNGTFPITDTGPNTFSYTLPGSQPSPDTSTSTTVYSPEGLTTTAFDQLGGAGIIYPLYITTQADIIDKFTTIGVEIPGLDVWTFTLFKPSIADGPINSYVINGNISNNYFASLQSYYSTIFFRGTNIKYLGNFMPPTARTYTYAPLLADLMTTDYVLFIRIQETTVGAYWVTTNANPTVPAPVYFGVKQTDPLSFSLTGALSRGLGPTGSPYYTLRGDSYNVSYNNRREINDVVINDTEQLSSLIQATYTDALNTNITIDRSGTPRIAIAKEMS